MSGVQGATLKKLTDEFEKKNPNIKIKLEYQGTYINLQAKLNSTMQLLHKVIQVGFIMLPKIKCWLI